LGQPVKEIFDFNRLFKNLAQAGGLSLHPFRHYVDVNADSDSQVNIRALVLGSRKHTADLLSIQKDVVHPLHSWRVRAFLLLREFLDHLKNTDRCKLGAEPCAIHVGLDKVADVKVAWRRGPCV
jgi:hypothetical protein